MPLILVVAGVLAVLNITVHAASDICYNPDGTQTTNSKFLPCLPTAEFTHCCASEETCLKNGLCLKQNNTALSTGLCTDSTWQDQACFPRCLKPSRRPGPSSLYRCSNDLWCCSNGAANTTSCCQDEGINLFPILAHATVENGSAFLHGYSIAPLASIMTGSVALSSTPTHSATTTDAAGSLITTTPAVAGTSADSDKVLATGLYSGLGVGVPLLAVVSILSFLLLREKRLHRATVESLSSVDSYGYPLVTPATSRFPSTAKPPVHLDRLPSATNYPVELNASTSSMSHLEADSREKRVSRKELPGS